MNTEPTEGGTGNSTAYNAAQSGNRSPGQLARRATHQLGDSLARGKAKLSEFQVALTEKTRECLQETDAYVRENPWKAIGWAAGLGFAIGLIVRRR